MSVALFDSFLSSPEMVAVFDDGAMLQAMFDFERALAEAQAAHGTIPDSAARAIAGVCKASLYDIPALVRAGRRAGSLAIPLVKELTAAVALYDAQASSFVHRGSTSQDVIDSAMELVTREAMALVERDLATAADALLALAERHAETPMLARTLMQPASVTSFGFKCAGWAAPLVRSRIRLRAAARDALKVQLASDGKWSANDPKAKPNQNEMNEWLDFTWAQAQAAFSNFSLQWQATCMVLIPAARCWQSPAHRWNGKA